MRSDHSNIFISNLFEKYQTAMIRRAYKYVRDIFDAEDIVSNCWIVLIRHASTLQSMEPPAQTTYIMQCVRTAAVDFMRIKQHRDLQLFGCSVEEAHWLCDAESNDMEDAVLLRMTLLISLARLPDYEREALTRKLSGYRAKEVGQAMGISESSARSYQARALHRLRGMIEQAESE